MLQEYIKMIKLFFHKAKAYVEFNGSPSSWFANKREIWQNFLLASYVFLIIVQILNAILKGYIQSI